MKTMLKGLVQISVLALVVSIFAVSVDAKVLTVGSTGSDVVALQSWLIANGNPIPAIQNGTASKGYFGEQTRDAVMMYQESTGSVVTGSIDSSVFNEPIVGSVTGPELMSPYWIVNGTRSEYRATQMYAATTSLCAMKGPSATSTLRFASWIINTGTSSAATIDIGTSTTAYATTTVLFNKTQASVVQGYGYWMPAGGSTNNDTAMMAPNTYVNVMAGGAGSALGGYTYKGYCTAIFSVLNP